MVRVPRQIRSAFAVFLPLVLLLGLAGLPACGTSAVGGRCDADADCDDANPCTLDTCDAVEGCLHEADVATLCDDGNPCTLETCDPETGCASDGTGVTGACDDGDACTVDDACQGDAAGTCQGGEALSCDDANPCTVDSCDAALGCQNDGIGVTEACDDGNVCTTSDACQGDAAGTCAGEDTSAVDCDDGDPCTADACDPAGGCVHSTEGVEAPCDDGNACTSGDVCQGDGTCAGQDTSLVDCDDGSLCTVDSCDPASGCLHDGTGIVEVCDDHNLCTTDDVCQGDLAGTCHGTNLPLGACDDGNICTFDRCYPDRGCVSDGTDQNWPCDDGNACTTSDRCQGDEAGTCQGVDTSAADCDDGNGCTADSCDPELGCQNDGTGITAACDDGSICTDDDQCQGDPAGTCAGTDMTAVMCDDGNACTEDRCDPVDGCSSELMPDHACFPTFVITYPPRGATIQGNLADPTVVVTGTVTSGAAPITAFSLNGVDVPLAPDGSFSQPVSVGVGGNVLVFEATDGMGSHRKRVQAFLWSNGYRRPTTPKNGMVSEGMAFWLAQEVLDDGDHSQPIDDFATIFEMVLQGFDLNGLLPNPVATNLDAGAAGTYDLYMNNLTWGSTSVSLNAINGGMHLTASIPNITADLRADKTCSWGWPPWECVGPDPITGDISIGSIVITADIMLSVAADHSLQVTLANSNVSVNNVNVNIDGLLAFIIEPIINGMIDDFIPDIEQQFEQEINTVLGPMLADALGALAINTSFDLPRIDGSGNISLNLVTDFQATDFDTQGGAFILRAGAYAAQTTPYTNLGVPNRINCGSPPQVLVVPRADPFEIVLADDTLNQLLYSAWNGGLLEFDAPPDMINLGDLSEYGITDLSLHVSAMLAPTAFDCNPGGTMEAFVGDMGVTVSLLMFDNPLDIQIWASLTLGMELTVADGEIAITITGVNGIETEVGVVQDQFVGLVELIGPDFETLLVDLLLGALGGETLAAIPIPEMDLSSALGMPPGSVVIAIHPQSVERIDGNTIIGGDLQ